MNCLDELLPFLVYILGYSTNVAPKKTNLTSRLTAGETTFNSIMLQLLKKPILVVLIETIDEAVEILEAERSTVSGFAKIFDSSDIECIQCSQLQA